MATRPTEADEHWTARQRLRKARRQEVAVLYEQKVVPKLASGCHIPGRTLGAPPVAHNSSNEAINYCGQVLEGTRPMIERLVRGDYYTAAGGGVGPGPGGKPEGKSFRCRADQPEPAESAPTPLIRDAVPAGSIRSTCGGRLIYDLKQRNLGLAAHDLPLKPLVDPLPRSARTASAPCRPASHRGAAAAALTNLASPQTYTSDVPSPTYSHGVQTEDAPYVHYPAPTVSARGVPLREASVGSDHFDVADAAVSTRDAEDCDLALAESRGKKKPHHCHHRHQGDGHHCVHHPHSSTGKQQPPQRQSTGKPIRHADPFATADPLPTTAQVRSIPLDAPRKPAPQTTHRPRTPGYLQATHSSKTKEAHVVVEKGPHYPHDQQHPPHRAVAHPAVRNAYENALQVAKEKNPGVAAVISTNELTKIRELANKPPTPRMQPQSHKPKDSANLLS